MKIFQVYLRSGVVIDVEATEILFPSLNELLLPYGDNRILSKEVVAVVDVTMRRAIESQNEEVRRKVAQQLDLARRGISSMEQD